MASHTIELEDPEYEYLKRSAHAAGMSVPAFLKQLIGIRRRDDAEAMPKTSRWAQLSERVRRDPPLRGAGTYVSECSRDFREDFAVTRDDVEQP